MSNEKKNVIRVDRSLGKSGKLFIVPEKHIYPLGLVTAGVFLTFKFVSSLISVDALLFLGIWLTLILTYTLFYGESHWKLIGEFHEVQNWVLGYIPFDLKEPQFKKKKKSSSYKVGYGKNTRKVTTFENNLHSSCLVEICEGKNEIGAYLLEKNKKYRLVFVFGFVGIRSNLDPEIIAEIIEALKQGLKDLPEEESLVFRCGTFAENISKINELNELKEGVRNGRVRYLVKALKSRFNQLLKKGKFNENICHIECSYTLDNAAIEGEDLLEKILVNVKEMSDKISGKKEDRQKYEALLKKAYREGYIFWRGFFRHKLRLQYYVYPLTANQIFQRDYPKYNDGKIPEKAPQILRLKNNRLELEINSPHHLTTNLFYTGSPDADKQWVYLPGKKKYIGGVTYRNKPGEWKGVKNQLEAGSFCLNSLETVDTEIVIELTKPNQEFIQAKTQRQTKDSNSNLTNAQKRGVIDVGADFNIKNNIETEKRFLEGEVVINVAWVGLIYRQSPESLRIAINHFKTLFRQPAIIEREKKYFDDIWLATLPFRWENILAKSGRRERYWSKEVPCLLPLSFESTKAKKGLCFISDKGGVPLHLHMYAQKPQTMAILGKKGSGKSVVMQGAVSLAQAYGLDTTIVDKTRGDGTGTFDTITKFMGGSYFNTMTESNNLFENVNPKDIPNLEKREAAEEIFKRFLKTGLKSLVIDKKESAEKRKNYDSVLTSSLEKFFSNLKIQNRYEAAHEAGIGTSVWQDIPTMKDFLSFLSDDYIDPEASNVIFETARHIRYQLKVIVESPLGRIIATPSTFDNSNRLVVYGIGDVDEEAMTPIALSAFSGAIRKSLRSNRSLLCMDEVSNLGSNYEIYGETLRGFCSRGRKEGVSVIYAGQDLYSIKSMPHSAQILENTDNYLIGKSTSSALELLEKELEIPRYISRQNTLDSFSDKNDNSTPWLLKSGSTLSFCHYYPSLQELTLIKNEPAFVELRDKYFSKYENPYEAIKELVKIIENN